ncbi:MAG TPA: DNA alkylation repair protein [Candidatus Saccharimonadales bacterium]|nr:DNA alkylation repair protein [Candidatus Saccharimonadales bacterium]
MSARTDDLIDKLQKLADRSPEDLQVLQKFFRTGEGQYAEGDVFIGVRMPKIRLACKKYSDLKISEIDELLECPVHEVRMAALIIMTNQAASKKTPESQKKSLFDLYLKRTDKIDNWDLVDVSCRDVVGGFLENKPRAILYKLAKSKSLWERRISIVSTWAFIRKGDLDDTFRISEMLLGDSHDLIHKATGWMLREAGKKDRDQLLDFLDKHSSVMPRTALRYAIEHLSVEQRMHFMAQKAQKRTNNA